MRVLLLLLVAAVGLCVAAFGNGNAHQPDVWVESHPHDDTYLVLLPGGTVQTQADMADLDVVANQRTPRMHLMAVRGQSASALQKRFPTAMIAANQELQTMDISVGWNLDRLDERLLTGMDGLWSAPSNGGAGVHLYIVDSGIDTAHPDFGGRANTLFSAYADTSDTCGHGSHVADTAGGSTHGVARGASIHAVKVLTGTSCGGSLTELSAGLLFVSQAAVNQRAVINLSLGFGAYNSVIGTLIATLIGDGHVVVAAAGNDGAAACGHYPASFPGVVSVAASNSYDALAAFSNYGSCVDITAPGVDVEAAATGTSGYRLLSGTSMATPHVVGVIALLWRDNPSWTGAQVTQAMIESATSGALTNLRDTPDRLLFWAAGSSVAVPSSSPAPVTGSSVPPSRLPSPILHASALRLMVAPVAMVLMLLLL